MKHGLASNVGKRELLRKYRKAFRIPENLNYYSAEDFKTAERSFIKHAILHGVEPKKKALIKSRPVLK